MEGRKREKGGGRHKPRKETDRDREELNRLWSDLQSVPL